MLVQGPPAPISEEHLAQVRLLFDSMNRDRSGRVHHSVIRAHMANQLFTPEEVCFLFFLTYLFP